MCCQLCATAERQRGQRTAALAGPSVDVAFGKFSTTILFDFPTLQMAENILEINLALS